ncbi:MAG: aminotransferase class I/II-fold pyridoxal phosphate-dependent enzyme [Eubacterium sp.]|nr:aminotransferase class I/II-fold pyridoxal phosphate-dependent enzyme [Eubacterium sp.]
MCDCLNEYCSDFISYVRPEGGLFIWAKLDEKIDMMQYVKKLLEYKVAVVPGTAFMIDDTAECHYIRLNYSTPSEENIIKGIRLMGEAFNKLKMEN